MRECLADHEKQISKIWLLLMGFWEIFEKIQVQILKPGFAEIL